MKSPFQPIKVERISEKSILLLFLLIAPIGVAATKGIVLLIVLAGIPGFLSWIKNGCKKTFLPVFPLTLLTLLLIWAGISSLWAIDPAGAALLTLRLTAICFCGLSILVSINTSDAVAKTKMENYFLAGYGFGAIVLGLGYLYATITGLSLWSSFSADPLTTLNNGSSVMALLFLPFATILWQRGKRVVVASASLMAAAALFFLSSSAAILSLLAGISVCAFITLLGRRSILFVGSVLAAMFLATPVLTSQFLKPPSIPVPENASLSSIDHRKIIWQFVNDRIEEKPLIGWGMDSSRDIPKDNFRPTPLLEVLPLHPHNLSLQVRLELGMPGTVLVTVFVGTLFWLLFSSGLPILIKTLGSGLISSYLLIGAISYGAWQNWWIALAWALAGTTCFATIDDKPRN